MDPQDTATPPQRWTISDLPFAARLTLAAFLVSVGLGYFSALVNLHFQEATPGNVLPDDKDVVVAYHGKSKMSQMERVLTSHHALPFNGSGSMKKVFMKPMRKFPKKEMERLAAEMKLDAKELKNHPILEEAFYKNMDGERVALAAWVRAGAEREAYENDAFKLEGKLKDLKITPAFVEIDQKGKRSVLIKKIFEARCTGCHSSGAGGPGSQYPLDDYEDIVTYTSPEVKGKSLAKLALTTHVHLLGFSMLYGLTGLILALTPLPGILRLPLAPLALVAQVVDISFWWLARLDEPNGPMFAKGIMVTGAIVGASLGLQILLSLWCLFRLTGRVILFILFAAVIGVGYNTLYPKVIEPYLIKERESLKLLEKEPHLE